MFAVLHFFDDNTIECVPASWLDGDYCYWPASSATTKIQKMSLPDKKKWRKYRYYEDYETARKYNKRALDTSNVETQSEGESKNRKQLVPSRFLSDSEIDSEGECVPSPPKKHQLRQC